MNPRKNKQRTYQDEEKESKKLTFEEKVILLRSKYPNDQEFGAAVAQMLQV